MTCGEPRCNELGVGLPQVHGATHGLAVLGKNSEICVFTNSNKV